MVLRLCLLLVLLFSLPLFGLKEECGEGIVLGYDAAFKVAAPIGWVFDDESCQRDNIPAVIYPVGKEWGVDHMPIISGDLEGKQGRTLDDIISWDGRVPHRDLLTLVTSDGREARVLEPVAKAEDGTLTRVAYIEAPDAVCQIRLKAPDQASFDKALPVFQEVVQSFRYFGPNSGEYLASSRAKSILLRTTEIQDLVTFSPPEGWNQERAGKSGATIFKRANGRGYGIIAIYPSQPSSGDAQADYEAGWKEVAQNAFAVGSAPAPQSRKRDSCQVRVGQVEVKEGERHSTVMLIVFSGSGKRTSILTSFNDRSLVPEVDDFLKMFYTQYTFSSAAGWSAGSKRSQDYVDGQLVNLSPDGYSSRNYDFRGNAYEFQGEIKIDSDHYVLVNESGSYFVAGNQLTLVGQGGTRRELNRVGKVVASRPLPAWRRTYTYKMVDIEGAIHGPYLVLRDVEENDVDGCYGNLFPKSFYYVRGYHPECRFQRF